MMKSQSGSQKTKPGSVWNKKNLRWVCIACRSVYKYRPGIKMEKRPNTNCKCGENSVLLPKDDLILDVFGKCKEVRGQVIL